MKLLPTQPTSSQALTLANTVRIEKLSDEENEEVDITDDLSDDGDCNEPQSVRSQQGVTDFRTNGPEDASTVATLNKLDDKTPQSPLQSSSLCYFETTAGDDKKSNGGTSPDGKHLQEAFRSDPTETPVESEALSLQSDTSPQTSPLEEEGTDCTGSDCCLMLVSLAMPLHLFLMWHCSFFFFFFNLIGFGGETERVLDEEEEDDDDDEIKAPEQEIEMDKESITEDEKQAIPEFFEGRPSKTPDRYLKIRNYILDQW